jgi:hypothetical protein
MAAPSASSCITSRTFTRSKSSSPRRWQREQSPRHLGRRSRLNANHAREHAAVEKAEALDLLQRNSREAAAAVRAIPDEALDRAAPVSLNADAPLTCQFFVEDHALRHSFHHLAKIRRRRPLTL